MFYLSMLELNIGKQFHQVSFFGVFLCVNVITHNNCLNMKNKLESPRTFFHFLNAAFPFALEYYIHIQNWIHFKILATAS